MKPYYEQDGITIYHGDCRDVLPTLPLVSTTITDPPYGQTSLDWDNWVDGWPELIPGTELWCFGSMRMFLDHIADFSKWRFGQDLVWQKHNGSSFHADRFRRIHENVVHFYRGPWGALRRSVPVTMDATRRTVIREKHRPNHMGDINKSAYQSVDGGPRLMTTVVPVRSCHGDAVHPTQKPFGILDPLVRYSTERGDTILDPFMGSGSTLVAAKELGRKAVGIEAEERYCEMAVKRLGQGSFDFVPSHPYTVSREETE